MIEAIHFNKEKPENNNILYPNKNDKKINRFHQNFVAKHKKWIDFEKFRWPFKKLRTCFVE